MSVEAVKVEIMQTIHSLQPYIRYQGGKTRLAKRIVALMPPHRVYVEPMVGGGSVYFAKKPAEREVISDADRDLMDFYRALKRGDVERCDLTPNREKFSRLVQKAKSGTRMTPCEYLYRNKISFGGKGTTPDPGAWVKCKGDKAKRCGVASKDGEKYKDRLKSTTILDGDYASTIRRYDSKDTLHYIDPPYAGTSTEGYRHGRDLTAADVRKVTDGIKGKMILSYNNSPQVREQFCSREAHAKGYRCRTVKTEYTINNVGRHDQRTELLITKGF